MSHFRKLALPLCSAGLLAVPAEALAADAPRDRAFGAGNTPIDAVHVRPNAVGKVKLGKWPADAPRPKGTLYAAVRYADDTVGAEPVETAADGSATVTPRKPGVRVADVRVDLQPASLSPSAGRRKVWSVPVVDPDYVRIPGTKTASGCTYKTPSSPLIEAGGAMEYTIRVVVSDPATCSATAEAGQVAPVGTTQPVVELDAPGSDAAEIAKLEQEIATGTPLDGGAKANAADPKATRAAYNYTTVQAWSLLEDRVEWDVVRLKTNVSWSYYGGKVHNPVDYNNYPYSKSSTGWSDWYNVSRYSNATSGGMNASTYAQWRNSKWPCGTVVATVDRNGIIGAGNGSFAVRENNLGLTNCGTMLHWSKGATRL